MLHETDPAKQHLLMRTVATISGVKDGSSSSDTTSFVSAPSMLKLRIGQHPIRLEEPDRPAGAPICREVSEDFANDTGELEAVARAWRRQDKLRRLRVQPENEVLVGAACVDAETRATNLTRGSRDIALQDRTQARLLVVGDLRPRLIRGCKIPAAQMRGCRADAGRRLPLPA